MFRSNSGRIRPLVEAAIRNYHRGDPEKRRDLAEKSKISLRHLRRLENQEHEISANVLLRLMEVCGDHEFARRVNILAGYHVTTVPANMAETQALEKLWAFITDISGGIRQFEEVLDARKSLRDQGELRSGS